MNHYKKIISIIAAVLLLVGVGLGIAGSLKGKNNLTGVEKYPETLIVDVFDTQANYQGLQSGWFAKVVKDRFNIEFNIIAPNVAGGGDTLYEARFNAGNMGDLIIAGADRTLMEMVRAGLVTDISPYLKDKEIMKYETAIRELNGVVSDTAIYCIPSELSTNSPFMYSETVEPTYSPYLRWDLYEQLGYPNINTLEDLLPILKKMQELEPTAPNGNNTYAFSFFKDWDGNMMNNAKQPACLYGYDELGFVLASADGQSYQSIIDADSLYIRSLHLFFEANQMGLVDPESRNQNYDSVFRKYQNGEILYCVWPWMAQSAYNTLENKEQGKGFMMVPITDMKIYSYGCRPMGNSQLGIYVGSRAKDPERLADFINWLYTDEGVSMNGAQAAGGTAGPEGLTWEMTEDGPVLTDFGVHALLNGDVEVPEEWGGGLWLDGISTLNFKPIAQNALDSNGYPYAYQLWPSVRNMDVTKLDQSWQEYMHASTTLEYLELHNMITVSPGANYTMEEESNDIASKRSACKAIIVEYSWNMIFAKDEEEFQKMQKTMQDKLKSLGYDDVYQDDLRNAKAIAKIKAQTVELYEE